MIDVALEILNKIDKLGFQSYIIGGYPRDRYLNISTDDIDICSNINEEVLVNNFNILKKNFYSYLIEYKSYKFEITLFRKEKEYIKHRYPKDIELVDNIEEDIIRRDFTINALCIDLNNNYVDFINSIDDLNNKIIRCIGDPKIKLIEDSLRMLRAIRFATILNFKLDKEIIDTIKINKELIKFIPLNKVKFELNKINNSIHKDYGYKLLKECEIIDYMV